MLAACACVESFHHAVAEDLRPFDETISLDHGDRRERSCARHRVAAERSAEPARVHGVHDLGAGGDAADRESGTETLGRRDDVGDDAFVLAREPRAGAPEAGLHLVGDEQHAVVGAPLCHAREPARFGHDEAAFARDGFDDDARHVRGIDVRVDGRDGVGQCAGAPERVRERGAVDLGRVRAERLLVRRHFRGEREAEQRAAVEGLVERDDRGPAGSRAGDLHRVLDRLRARVHEQRALLVRTRECAR